MAQEEDVIPVSRNTLREMFNTSQYPELIRQRVLTQRFIRDTRLTRRRAQAINEPSGTRSQIVRYYDEQGVAVLEAHRYQRPDRSIGGSGQLDPKWMRLGGKIWRLRFEPEDEALSRG